MRVRTLSRAERDIADAAEFYERQQRGLGWEFAFWVDSQLRRLAETAGIHRQELGFHKVPASGRFPYAVFYELDGDDVVVYAVQDGRQNPELTQALLRSLRGESS